MVRTSFGEQRTIRLTNGSNIRSYPNTQLSLRQTRDHSFALLVNHLIGARLQNPSRMPLGQR